MTEQRKNTLILDTGLQLRLVDGIYLPVLPPDTPVLTTKRLLEGIREMEDEEDLRHARLAGMRPSRK